MKELFQLSFRCTKLKCGVIWAFVVTSAPGPRRERHLGSAACRVPSRPVPSLRAAGGRVAARLQLSLMTGAFCAVGAVLVSRSRRFHAEHKYKLKNLWNPSWKVLRMFSICIYFILLFYNCFVFFKNFYHLNGSVICWNPLMCNPAFSSEISSDTTSVMR